MQQETTAASEPSSQNALADREPQSNRLMRLAPLLALPLVPALPGIFAFLVLAVILLLWLRVKPPRWQVWLVGACSVALVGILAFALIEPPSTEQRVAALQDAWSSLWRHLDGVVEEAAAGIEAPPADDAARLRVFRELAALAGEHTVHLLDPEGDVVAWAGTGLLHDLEVERIPSSGRSFHASFSAATLLVVRPLAEASGWRVVAGRSFSVDSLPVDAPRGWEGRTLRWTLRQPGQAPTSDLLWISLAETPTLVIEELERDVVEGESRRDWARRWAWLAVSLLLFLLALRELRSRGAVVDVDRESEGQTETGLTVGAAAVAAIIALSLAVGLPPLLTVGLAVMAALLGLSAGRQISSVHGGVPTVVGLVAIAVPLVGGFAIQRSTGSIDLAENFVDTPLDIGLRLLVFVVTFICFRLIGRRRGEVEAPAQRWAWLAVAALLAAAAQPDRTVVAIGALAVGGACFGLWRHRDARTPRLAAIALVVLIAALAAATSWEIAFRHRLRHEIGSNILADTAFPSGEELDQLIDVLDGHFASLDLRDYAPLGATELDRRDLAYEIWRHSPLARAGVLSALVVFTDDDSVSRFAFGLPLSEEGEVDWTPTRWPHQDLPSNWQEAGIVGEAELAANGEPWGWVRYWIAPQPGFRLAGDGLDVLAAGLLGEGPVSGRFAPEPSLYALYSERGEVLTAPWSDTPPLDPDLLDGRGHAVETPSGPAWAFAATGEDGVRVIYLPVLGTPAALERTGTQAVGLLLVLLTVVLISLPVVLTGRGLLQLLERAYRSYSKRLVITYSLLLLVPILVMNVAVLRMVERRLLREQRSAGQAALESAQRVLGEYVLSLEPGFGFEASLDDELLIWLSSVVNHDVNLYWRSNVLASSKPELFTAGLLPTRIPGEIYSRLTLLGHKVSSRVTRAADLEYVELYAPLEVPGVPVEQALLFLSTPLSAQQEEVSLEVASLRRKALLGSTMLVLLLVAIGTRFARSFTTPLQEIVRGTQRIAAGEASLELAPRESELATLVEAIDRMAARIAEGRRNLLHEKGVVERIVESITSGVVSLDGQGRVLMRNRVAAELLGVEVGEAVAEALARDARLDPVREFLDGAEEAAQQRMVRLQSAAGEDQDWSLVWVPLPGEGEPTALLVVEDVTEVVRGQRLEAWAEMARMIAHEIKNPLTPIRLSTEHMTRVYNSDRDHFEQVFESCTSNILRQVQELQQISSEFSTYSRIPRIHPTEGDLAAAVESIVDGYRAAPPKGINISFSAEESPIPARFDAKLLGRAVRNLLENALQATSEGGEVRVEVGAPNGRPRISVLDTGSGVAPAELPRIFDPYFSTFDTGTGLGLPIAKRIAEEHGGQISARNRPEGGLEVTISLVESASA